MFGFVAKKLLSVVAVLLVVSALVYFLGRGVVPGNVAQLIVGTEGATPAQLATVRHRLGLDKPIYVGYIDWLGHAVTGDLGTSPTTGLAVSSELGQELPVSLELAVVCLIITAAVGVPLGVMAATRADGVADAAIRVSLLGAFGVPAFITAILLVLIGSKYLGSVYQAVYTPIGTNVPRNLQSIVLPVVAAIIPPLAVTVQVTRSLILDVLSEPFVAMARAKGTPERRVIWVHALRPALPGITTLLAFMFGILLTDLVVVETVFNLPGLGRGLVTAIGNRDFQLLVPQVIIVAAIFVSVNMLAELVQPFLDPRLRPA